MANTTLNLMLLKGRYAVCFLPAGSPVPYFPASQPFLSITHAGDELSIVCAESLMPAGARAEQGWRAIKIQGPLDFSLVGILKAVLDPLAAAGVSIFALSTYQTDYVLIRDMQVKAALDALQAAGHHILAE